MSAWLCTDRHFMFLAKVGEVMGLTEGQPAEMVALRLKRENMLSLNARLRR